MRNFYKIFSLLVAFTMLIPNFTGAIEFIGTQGENVNLETTKQYDEMIITGGKNVNLTGKILDGAVVAAETLNIEGEVNNHVFALAGTTTISNKINGNLIILGDKITIASGAVIEGDVLVLAGSNISVEGKIEGNLTLKAAQKLTISGEITKDVDLGNIENFSVLGGAILNGNIKGKVSSYNIANNAIVSGDNQITIRPEHNNNGNMTVAGTLIGFVSVLIAVLLIQAVFPKYMERTREITFEEPLKSMGWGILMLIGLPIAAFSMIALIAPYLAGILVMLAWVIFMILGIIFSHIWIGDALTNKKLNPFLAALIGSVVFLVLGVFPLLKLVAGFLIFLLGFGGAVKSLMSLRSESEK